MRGHNIYFFLRKKKKKLSLNYPKYLLLSGALRDPNKYLKIFLIYVNLSTKMCYK